MQNEQINTRHSEEIQAIITKVPSWIVRWGILIFGAILLMALSVSAVIRYPETITLPAKIQTTGNPAIVFAVTQISQENFVKVKKGQQVLVRLKVYSSGIYPALKGVIQQIAGEPDAQGYFQTLIKVNAPVSGPTMHLKNWMTGSAEVITQDVTILQRITKNMVKI